MPLRPPRLDDRGYDDLVAELVARIPAHTPEWTNPRPGDPGRTLIELFAWLGDALLYRANLIPERQRLAFLKLLGTPLQPARPAGGVVTVSLKDGEQPEALQIKPIATLKGPVTFEARDEFTVLPVAGAAYCKRPTTADDLAPDVESALSDFYANGAAITTYFATTVFTAAQATYDPVDVVADTTDRCLWFALLAPAARPPANQPAQNDAVRNALGGSLLNVGIVPAFPSLDPLEPATGRVRVPHVWEITVNTTGQPVQNGKPWRPEYAAIDEVRDTTAGLTRPGVMRLELPRAQILHAPENDVRADTNAGVGDRPPRVDDETVAARIVAWVRLRPQQPSPSAQAELQFATGQDAPSPLVSQTGSVSIGSQVEHLRIVWAGVNAVEVEQLQTYGNLIVGESSGAPDQLFQLPVTSIEPETLVLEVEDAGRWDQWMRVDDLMTLDPESDDRAQLDAARDARAYQLDAEAGTVLLGDGVRGRVPSAGSRIRARQLRAGGGAAGNLPARTLKTIAATTLTGDVVSSRLTVVQPLAFDGGADAETLSEAERRIPSRLQHRDRAVTAEDYTAIAFETPGVAIGRVELLPRFKPQLRHPGTTLDTPGVVSVMVLPDRPLGPPPNPRADRPFLEAVYAWIDPRRPLATELYVIGCEYVPIAVSVAVSVEPDQPIDATMQAVKDALRQVLWPLPGGGFRGDGWPLGRSVSNRELLVEVARVRGVSEVGGLNLFSRNGTVGTWKAIGDSRNGQEQTVTIEQWQLPELLAVVVTDASSAPLTMDASNPFADPSAVPLAVPAVPTTC